MVKGSYEVSESGVNMNIETQFLQVPSALISHWGWAVSQREELLRYMDRNPQGKTTVALHMVAEVQKRGGIAGFIDAEHALDPVYKNIGVDIDDLYIFQPDNGEQGLEITEKLWYVPAL